MAVVVMMVVIVVVFVMIMVIMIMVVIMTMVVMPTTVVPMRLMLYNYWSWLYINGRSWRYYYGRCRLHINRSSRNNDGWSADVDIDIYSSHRGRSYHQENACKDASCDSEILFHGVFSLSNAYIKY
jgi:hypothetical protein